MTMTSNRCSDGATDLLDTFTTAAFEHAPRVLHEWYDPPTLREQLRESLRQDVQWLSDEEFATSYHEHCALPGTTPDDFRNRVLTLSCGTRVLIGIRFFARDRSRPFVELAASTASLWSEAQLTRATNEVAADFAVFTPQFVRFTGPAADAVDPLRLPSGSHVDLVYVAAPLAALRTVEPPVGMSRVSLRRAEPLAWYERYVLEYASWHARDPKRRDFAQPEDLEDLEESSARGHLFEVLVDGAWAGVVSVQPRAEQGLRGFVVQELLLAAHVRGQGLGAVVQAHLARTLDGAPGDVLYGTIHAHNAGALSAARRAGRLSVLYQWMIATT